MLAFSVGGLQPKKDETAVNHLAQVATQPIVRRQAALRAHHRISLADLM
jgi:hypothetical protein